MMRSPVSGDGGHGRRDEARRFVFRYPVGGEQATSRISRSESPGIGKEHARSAQPRSTRPGPVQARQPHASGAARSTPKRRAGADAAADAGPPPSARRRNTPAARCPRRRLKPRSAADFTAVRVHTSSYAESIGARAFTRGTDLFFAPGAYDPKSLLAIVASSATS